MNRVACFTILLVLAPIVLAQHAQSPVSAKLVVPDAKTLPGVPFDMWVELKNSSDASVGVGLCANLLVRPDGAEVFEAKRVSNRYPVLLPGLGSSVPVQYLVLSPGESKTLTLPIHDHLGGAEFFSDHRLSPPGRYYISLRLDYCWSGWTTPQESLLPSTFLGPVMTNEVAIERVEPTGSDATVWKRMQELSGGRWSLDCLRTTFTDDMLPADCTSRVGSELWNEIRTKYPNSNYVPYALLVAPGLNDSYLQSVLSAIKRFTDSPVVELLHWDAAGVAAAVGREDVYSAETAKVMTSSRPTTRILALGRQDVKVPCPIDYDCKP